MGERGGGGEDEAGVGREVWTPGVASRRIRIGGYGTVANDPIHLFQSRLQFVELVNFNQSSQKLVLKVRFGSGGIKKIKTEKKTSQTGGTCANTVRKGVQRRSKALAKGGGRPEWRSLNTKKKKGGLGLFGL